MTPISQPQYRPIFVINFINQVFSTNFRSHSSNKIYYLAHNHHRTQVWNKQLAWLLMWLPLVWLQTFNLRNLFWKSLALSVYFDWYQFGFLSCWLFWFGFRTATIAIVNLIHEVQTFIALVSSSYCLITSCRFVVFLFSLAVCSHLLLRCHWSPFFESWHSFEKRIKLNVYSWNFMGFGL